MEAKKNPKANLELRKSLFMQIGLILALGLVYLSINYKTYDYAVGNLGDEQIVLDDEEIIPITERQKPTPPPPPPPPPQEQIVVVKDDVQLEEELQMESSESDESMEVSIEDVFVEEEEEEVFNFQVVESQPVYPGCENEKTKQDKYDCFQKSILKHVKDNFDYPEIAKEMGVQGRVIVQFVISKTGKVTEAKILRGVDKNLDKEALRIVSKIPGMTPAQQRGRPVPVSFMLPITFKLQ